MTTRLTILSDNCVGDSRCLGEHGFSVFIETPKGRYLFDTGQGRALPHNMKALGVSATPLHSILVSHGHFDHTGGLKWALEAAGGSEVVAHPGMFEKHLAVRGTTGNESREPVGCPFSRDVLESAGARFRWVDRTERISDDLWFIAGIERTPAHTPKDPHLVLATDGGFEIDPIREDASILLETDGHPILILGCAHAGLGNILEHVRLRMGIRKLKAIFGGTHLMFFPESEVGRMMGLLDRFEIDRIGVSHCTGTPAALQMASHFGKRFSTAAAGSIFEL